MRPLVPAGSEAYLSMDQLAGQKRRKRPEDDRNHTYPSQIPRPYYAGSSRIPVQISAPPRTYQNRTGPPIPYARNPVPPQQNSFRKESTSNLIMSQPTKTTHSDRQPPNRSTSRQLSHISSLSMSQPDTGSRPISESFVGSPGLPSGPVSEIGEEEGFAYHSNTHSRGGSQGRKTRTTTPPRSRKNSMPLRDSATLPSAEQAATVEVLTAAIRQGLNPSVAAMNAVTSKPFPEISGLRMPFQEPSSPSSIYTDGTMMNNTRLSMPLSSFRAYDTEAKPDTIIEQEANERDTQSYEQDLPTPMSTHPIIAGKGPGMSSKIPPAKRPLKLDIGAVREAESRGSMTSLSDLIQRATRLASNLDRGKTASRLGYLDMFGSNDKLANIRGSTYSDVLDAFPDPSQDHGSDAPGASRPRTMWPVTEKQFIASKSSLGRFVEVNEKEVQVQPQRRYCGLKPAIFLIAITVILLLVSAAVLVPVLLLVLPNQQKSASPANCATNFPCQNGGYSVAMDNVCSCICVDGFTGDDCSTERDPECTTAIVNDGSNTYDNATVGSSVLPLLKNSKDLFNIELNETIILSQFAFNNLSCTSENSLVDFGIRVPTAEVKRFIILPGMMNTSPPVPALNLPSSESKEHPRFVIVEGLEDAAEQLHFFPTHTLEARQDATQSANGIVFASTSNTATATATATGSGSSPSSTSTSIPSSKINATDDQLDFAATVVLYVLQVSSHINNAVTANQAILTFFQANNHENKTVEVIGGETGMQADFGKFQISFSNGTVIGGGGSVKTGT